MAAVLEISMLCNKILDLSMFTELLCEYRVSIESVNSIDNWLWENERSINDTDRIADILDMQHIAIIKLKQPMFKDMGVYIEKVENQYLYTLWINIEGYSELDCERITVHNREFYEKIVETILELNKPGKGLFEVAGIGVETDIQYNKNVMDIIRNSKNVAIWLLNRRDELNTHMEGYEIDILESVCVLRKK